jgi:hypothetical protein
MSMKKQSTFGAKVDPVKIAGIGYCGYRDILMIRQSYAVNILAVANWLLVGAAFPAAFPVIFQWAINC